MGGLRISTVRLQLEPPTETAGRKEKDCRRGEGCEARKRRAGEERGAGMKV